MSTRASSNAQRSQAAKVHSYVNRQLDKTRRQVKSTELITHLLVVTIFVVGFLQLMALVDAWVWSFNSIARWLSFIVLVGTAVGYLLLTVGPLLLRKIHPDYAAKMIEDVQPTFKNSLLNYVSLRKQPKATHAAVMDAVTKQAAIDLQTVPEDATVDRSSIVQIGFYLLGLIAFVAFYWMLSPKDPLQSFSRILLPSAKKSAPSIVQVTDVSPGDQEVFFGDPVVVSATIKGQFSPEDVKIVYSTRDGQVVDQVLPMQLQTTSSNRYEATLTSSGEGGVVRGLVYKVIARDGASPDYEIVVRPNPSITLTTAEITPPAYTLLPQETISGQGTIEVVEGSLIKVNAVANLPIKLAYIELLVKHPKNNTDFVVVETVSMTANEMEAHGEFHAIYNYQAQKQRATHFRLKFLSTEGDANQNANVHPMRIIADLAPQIEVLNPIQNVIRMPINETLLIDVRATDTDYGISSIELEMQNNGTNLFRKQKLPLQSEDGKKRVRGQFQFTPEKHFLRVGETVLFTATASDNRTSYLSGSLDPNQTMTRPYQIEILDAVENPKRSAKSDPNKGEENSEKQGPSEQGEQSESEGEESGESGEAGSSSEGGDASEQSESGDEGESGADGESGDEGGDSSQSGDSESQGQQGGDQGGSSESDGGESEMESDPNNGGQESGDSEGESGNSEGAGSENAGSEGGSESATQQKSAGEGSNQDDPSGEGSQENGSQGSNTQGSQSQSQTPNSDAQDSGNQSAGSEGGSQGDQSGSQQQGGAEGARKPLADDAADGDVMSRMEEIMKEEKSKEGGAAGEESNGQDQKPAEQNTGRGTDPNQENPRQSEGTGSMQQDDNQPPKDAQGADNNAQRGDGKSSSSQGEQNGTAKGSSGNETGDQSQEGASSENSKTGQSDETGGNDPGNAASESSQENQQQSGESGNGESGKSGQSSQEGAKPSEEAGEGSSGQQKSGGDEAGKQGGGEQGGGEQGGGEQGGGEQGGGEQGGGEQGDGEQGGGEQGGGEQGGGEQGGGEQGGGEQGGDPSGEGGTGEGQSSGPQQSSESQSSSSSGKAGGSEGGGPGGETIAEKENTEHSKKATDMVLKRLEQERFEPDPELLEELNWSKEDLNQFLDRWQQMKAAAGTGDPIARQRYDKALKSLGLSSDASQKKVRGVSDKQEGFNTDSAVNRPPQEIAPGYRAFKRARNRSKN